MAKIDYFQATIDEKADKIIDGIIDAFDGTKRLKNGFLGYAFTTQINIDQRYDVFVYHGGNNGASPNVKTSGEFADVFRPYIQSAHPKHRVTRIDSAIDLYSADFDALYEAIHPISNKRRVKECIMGDWYTLGSPAGRTVYWGSTKSTAMVRMYEKGKEQKAQLAKLGIPSMANKIPDNWVRVEAQIRPSKQQKQKAAIALPEEIFGFAAFAADIFRLLTDEDIGTVPILPNNLTDTDKGLMIMTKQYKRYLRRKADELGGYEELGLYLEQLIKEAAET